MFGLFHMAGLVVDRDLVVERSPDPPRDRRRPTRAARRGRAARREHALLHPRGVATHPRRRTLVTTRRGVVEALTGTSLVTLDLIDAIKARFPGSWTSIAYGSTEIGRGATLLDPDLYDHPGSVGQPPPMVTATLSDDGELWLRGPTMFSGYLDRPDATAEAIDDEGWFHTGDLATRDADGYFTITGRRSESIRSGGEWVAPIEVETAIRSHPAVEEVAVVGLPDDRWGELVCAAIVVRERRDPPHRRGAARPPGRRAHRGQATPRRRAGRRPPPHRRHRARSGVGGCATRSSPSAAREGHDRFGRNPHPNGRMRCSPLWARVDTTTMPASTERPGARRSTVARGAGPADAPDHRAGRGRGSAGHARVDRRHVDRPRPQRGPPPRAAGSRGRDRRRVERQRSAGHADRGQRGGRGRRRRRAVREARAAPRRQRPLRVGVGVAARRD